jgi:DnaJ-class molecular chaperone
MPTLNELYKTLEINKNATPEEIKQARDRLAKKYHPDKNNNSEEAKIKFQKIQEAYEILTSSQKRDEYDDLIGSAQQ